MPTINSRMTLGMPFYTKEICKGQRRPPEIDGTTCPHESWQGCFASFRPMGSNKVLWAAVACFGKVVLLNGRHFVIAGPNGPNTAQMAGSTAVVEVALRNRFKDGEGARVLGCASAGQWLYLSL